MVDFFEIDEINKSTKTLNLDDFSIDDLKKYIDELTTEIDRAKAEIEKKSKFKKDAEGFFK